jgi:hypothetical protein
MARIFISGAREDSAIESLIRHRLSEEHEVLRLDMRPGYEWQVSIKDALQSADVIVALVTESFLNSKYGYEELQYITSYTANSKRKLFLPVVIGEIDVPSDISQFVYISLDPREAASLDKTIFEIDRAIASHQGRVIAKEEIAFQQKEKIETKATEYVDEAISELKGREDNLTKNANFWYWMGYGAIAIGVAAAAVFSFFGYSQFNGQEPKWDLVAFTAIKSIFLVGLLLGIAKYSFSLAKSYMEESLKNADRIHAISFGKFFLQAFGDEADSSDIKEVFQHWNISGKNSFSNLSADSVEPKVFEMALEFAKAMKSGDKKSPNK